MAVAGLVLSIIVVAIFVIALWLSESCTLIGRFF